MPLTVNIKTKPPKFEGDQPRHHAVVSGPSETFQRPLRRYLELHGLSPLREEDDFSIWSSRPAIGGPPLYLAATLSDRYHATVERETGRWLRRAAGELAREDGLERFLGAGTPLGPGRQPLSITAGTRVFVANCEAEHQDRIALLSGAGWLPVEAPSAALSERFGTMPFHVRDPFLADNLSMFMDEGAKALLGRLVGGAMENIRLSRAQAAPEDFHIPRPEGEEYLPFQVAGVHALRLGGGSGIIADEMGLGKTIQGIGAINMRPDARNILVICEANMRIKWAREIEKWRTDPDLEVGIVESGKIPETPVVVVNYDIVARNREGLAARRWDIIITDEAHRLKNPEAQRTRAILGDVGDGSGASGLPLAENGQLILLTGTPRPNRAGELWPLLTATRPDIWGRGPAARLAFLNRYNQQRESPVLQCGDESDRRSRDLLPTLS